MYAMKDQQGFALFYKQLDYEPPSKTNIEQSYMHLTNYTLNKQSENYQVSNSIIIRLS